MGLLSNIAFLGNLAIAPAFALPWLLYKTAGMELNVLSEAKSAEQENLISRAICAALPAMERRKKFLHLFLFTTAPVLIPLATIDAITKISCRGINNRYINRGMLYTIGFSSAITLALLLVKIIDDDILSRVLNEIGLAENAADIISHIDPQVLCPSLMIACGVISGFALVNITKAHRKPYEVPSLISSDRSSALLGVSCILASIGIAALIPEISDMIHIPIEEWSLVVTPIVAFTVIGSIIAIIESRDNTI